MDERALHEYITETFRNVGVVEADGSYFYFYGAARQIPIITLVTRDAYDTCSDLARPGVFRLNIGLGKGRFKELFPIEGVHDFTALDVVMPHPAYASMCWVCVLNPGEKSWEMVRILLGEAYEKAASRGGSGW